MLNWLIQPLSVRTISASAYHPPRLFRAHGYNCRYMQCFLNKIGLSLRTALGYNYPPFLKFLSRKFRPSDINFALKRSKHNKNVEHEEYIVPVRLIHPFMSPCKGYTYINLSSICVYLRIHHLLSSFIGVL